MPSIYFRVKYTSTQPVPTWFAFAGDTDHLFYGFPENSWEKPGYVRISPDFVLSNITSPKDRTNQVPLELVAATQEFVRQYVLFADPDQYLVEDQTCLASMVPGKPLFLSSPFKANQSKSN